MRIAKMLLFIFSLSVVFVFSVRASASVETLAVQAVSGNAEEARAAVGKLREMKQSGLDALFEKYNPDIERYKQTGEKSADWPRIASAIDAVAMQKDAYASRLFWHTDLEEARRVSKETGKPILSLRLLGNLSEEFSCANSRFFRAVLYANSGISDILRARFVLHWQSVRPAPRITVDFGDGRRIERTVTGNSIHYVLDENALVVNALPGLYSPEEFYKFLSVSSLWLDQAKAFESGRIVSYNSEKVTDKRRAYLKNMREREYSDLRARINRDLNYFKMKFDAKKEAKREFEEMPTAVEVAFRAMAKMVVERPLLKDYMADITKYGADQIDLENWKKLAAVYAYKNKLDEKSIAFIRRQTRADDLTDEQFASLIAKFETLVSLDTVRNDFLLRPTLLVWLNKDLDKDLDSLSKKVYDELFLTPNADPWLGLYAPDIYTALDGGGITN